MAAEVTPAIQVDGVAPTVTPIADVEMCFRLNHLPPLHSRSNSGSPDGACLQDRPPHHKYGARFCITVPEDRQRNIIQHLERQSKQTHWRIRQNYRHRRPDQPRPTAPPPPLSRQILAVNVANISNKTSCYPQHLSGTPGSGPSQRPASPHLNFAYCPWIRCHPASSHGTWTQRNRPRCPIVLWWS
ncbi:hypothetical protein BASA83_012984 [Batrachochytrium salamandrivorans]|nr:hypothetical protein BASA83_012984 [Batrachochytrium salamandrivorans]